MTAPTFDLHHMVRLPKASSKPAPVLFLFHGLGGNETNLHDLSDHVPEDWLVVSARGPISIGADQFKWFEIAHSEGIVSVDIESEDNARRHVQGFMEQTIRAHRGDASRIVVAGFSQGATLTMNLFLTQPDTYMGAGAFSGRVMDEIKPHIASKDTLTGKHVFLGFGTQDSFIPQTHAAQTLNTLEELGIKVRTSYDDVGHSISGKHWMEFVDYLSGLHKA